MTTADARCLRFMARHHGVVTLAEALDLGLTRRQIELRVRRGTWLRLAPGVYADAGAPATPHQSAYAACLAGPTGTVASHLTAAALFGLLPFPTLPHVTIAPTGNHRSRLSRSHRSPVGDVDRTYVGIIPVTTPARTLVDCAGMLERPGLHDVADLLFDKRLARPEQVAEAQARASSAPGRKGSVDLDSVIDPWLGGIVHDSVAEARMFRLVVSWGLPVPQALYVVRDDDGGFVAEVDAAWPDRMVALEYEGGRAHNPTHWERDEPRYRRLVAAGWTVVPVDKSDLHPGFQERFRSDVTRALRGSDAA